MPDDSRWESLEYRSLEIRQIDQTLCMRGGGIRRLVRMPRDKAAVPRFHAAFQSPMRAWKLRTGAAIGWADGDRGEGAAAAAGK